MLELSVFPCSLTGHCLLVNHMAMVGLTQNSNWSFYEAKDKNSEYLTSNCTTITEIRVNHLGKDVLDMGKYFL